METLDDLSYSQDPTFEKLWLALRELGERQDKKHEESREEFHKELKERDEQFERKLDRSSRKLNKSLGKLGIRFGEVTERMIGPGLIRRFKPLGFTFDKMGRNVKIEVDDRVLFELDAVLENRDQVMVVEMKVKPTTEDVKENIERMDKLKRYVNNQGDTRRYYSAIGASVFDENEREYTLKCGFYVIEPSGASYTVFAPAEGWRPREW